MAEYIIAWLEKIPKIPDTVSAFTQERHYEIFNGDNSVINREQATLKYELLKSLDTTISVSLSKLIESKSFPERLK